MNVLDAHLMFTDSSDTRLCLRHCSLLLWQSLGVGVLCGVYMLACKPCVPISPLLRELMLSHFSKQNPTNTNKPTHEHTKACSQCWLIFAKSIQPSLPAGDSGLLCLSWNSCVVDGTVLVQCHRHWGKAGRHLFDSSVPLSCSTFSSRPWHQTPSGRRKSLNDQRKSPDYFFMVSVVV